MGERKEGIEQGGLGESKEGRKKVRRVGRE